MEDSYILIKLNTSEEVIAKIEDETEGYYTLSRPRLIAPMSANNGHVSIAFIPWLMGAQDPETGLEYSSTVLKSSITGMAVDVPKKLIDAYLKQISNIIL